MTKMWVFIGGSVCISGQDGLVLWHVNKEKWMYCRCSTELTEVIISGVVDVYQSRPVEVEIEGRALCSAWR